MPANGRWDLIRRLKVKHKIDIVQCNNDDFNRQSDGQTQKTSVTPFIHFTHRNTPPDTSYILTKVTIVNIINTFPVTPYSLSHYYWRFGENWCSHFRIPKEGSSTFPRNVGIHHITRRHVPKGSCLDSLTTARSTLSNTLTPTEHIHKPNSSHVFY